MHPLIIEQVGVPNPLAITLEASALPEDALAAESEIRRVRHQYPGAPAPIDRGAVGEQ